MTEEEARQKWCPMVQNFNTPDGVDSNRPTVELMNNYCIASNCMMWAWERHVVEGGSTEVPFDVHGQGYCGLTHN